MNKIRLSLTLVNAIRNYTCFEACRFLMSRDFSLDLGSTKQLVDYLQRMEEGEINFYCQYNETLKESYAYIPLGDFIRVK